MSVMLWRKIFFLFCNIHIEFGTLLALSLAEDVALAALTNKQQIEIT